MKLSFSLILFSSLATAAILSIDYGTEWTKAALVKPGIPLEMVLTKDTKRKEQSVVAFKGQERLYGGDAANLAARFPAQTFPALKTLLGETFDGEAASHYRALYPATKMSKTGDGGISFETQGESFSVEELVAMQFINMRRNAETMAGSSIRDVVLTVPAYFDQAQRLALIDAARLADLRVLELLSDGLSVALDYAKARTFESPQIHIIYDMGAGSTTATIIRAETNSVKDVGRFNKTVTTLEVLGTGMNTIASGNTMTERLFEYLVEQFDTLNRDSLATSVLQNARASARLLKEATRIKQVLSANNEVMASVESLHEDKDFRHKVTRAKFEELTADLAPLSVEPIHDAIVAAKLSTSEIHSLILHGGSVRVPFIQKALIDVVGEDKIARNVNGDEAASLGAVFRGAALSGSFRVKELRLQDQTLQATSYSIDSRTHPMFAARSALGAQNNLTFSQMTKDFELNLQHDSFRSPNSVTNFANVVVAGVENATSILLKDFHCKSPELILAAVLDSSGIVDIVEAFASCEVDEKQGMADKLKGWFGSKETKDERQDQESQSASQTKSSNSDEISSQKVVKKLFLNATLHHIGRGISNDKDFSTSLQKIRKFEKIDTDRIARETAYNELESCIYRARDQLDSKNFLASSTDEERSRLQQLAAEANEWMSESGQDATIVDLVSKRRGISKLTDSVLLRQRESTSRPGKIEELQKQLASSRTFLKRQIQELDEFAKKKAEQGAKKAESDPPIDAPSDDLEDSDETGSKEGSTIPEAIELIEPLFSREALKPFEDELDTTENWLQTNLKEQKTRKINEDPVLWTKDLTKRTETINEGLRSLISQATYRQQPKPKPKPKSKSKSKSKAKSAAKSSEKSSSDGQTDDAASPPAGSEAPDTSEPDDQTNIEKDEPAAGANPEPENQSESIDIDSGAEPAPVPTPELKDEL